MTYFYNYPLLSIFLVGVVIVFLACEIGWQLGRWKDGHGVGGNIAAVEQSLLGLLALMVGFSFLMALTRFETRREAVLYEANAIGTTALRARLLPEPHRTESLKLLREYAQIRVNDIPSGKSLTQLSNVISRSNQIHEELWQQVKALSAKDNNMVPTGLFIQTLNDMIDNQAKRLSILRNQIPEPILFSLFAIAAISCGFAGYASRLDPLRTRLPAVITAALVSAVIFVILDLGAPSAGLIKIDQQSMIDTAASLSAFTD
jgi:hypothetical protein